jgi:hypothetical protein
MMLLMKLRILSILAIPLVGKVFEVMQDGKVTRQELDGVLDYFLDENDEIVFWRPTVGK